MLYPRAAVALALCGACSFQRGALPTDDANGVVDAPPDTFEDAPMSDGGMCYGTFLRVCLQAPPQQSYQVTAPTTLDTDTSICTHVVTQMSGPALCVIAAQAIQVNAHLRAKGTRPLVLLGTQTISIAGGALVDVGSWRDVSVDPFVEVIGAGGASGSLCGSPTNGGNDNGGSAGAGGGAGGSFGGKGGNGARGRNNSGGTAGVAADAIAAPTFVRGGCRGTNGGSGDGNTGGSGAAGGGAVTLIAGTSINNAGHVRANGMGGYGGGEQSGGGGGGSGGMIVLDAPSITSTGILNANGGGGGGGGGAMSTGGIASSGTSGTAAAAPGSGGGFTGGSGGSGSFGASLVGGNGATNDSGAGGGGGGAGVIKVVPAQTLGGTVSPPAS